MPIITQDPPTSRSPIKDPPLPLPGQSLDEAYHDLDDEQRGSLAYAIVFCVLLIGLEWMRWAFNMKPHPWLVMMSCAVFLVLVYRDFRRSRQDVKNLKQGRDGEREVAQVLNALAMHGCHIFHDIRTDRGNLDHAIISRYGVFAIETKAPSKRGRNPKILYDGEHLDIEGMGRHDEMVDQAEAQAQWMKHLLSNETGKAVQVQAVVTFPGWFVKASGKPWEYRTWVVNPKALLKMVPNGGEVVGEEFVREMAYRLRKHILEKVSG